MELKNKKEKGESTRQNIQKQIVKVQEVHQKLSNIRTHYINKTINEIVKQKPSYRTIEDLKVRGMMKNKHLSRKCKNIQNRIDKRVYICTQGYLGNESLWSAIQTVVAQAGQSTVKQ